MKLTITLAGKDLDEIMGNLEKVKQLVGVGYKSVTVDPGVGSSYTFEVKDEESQKENNQCE